MKAQLLPWHQDTFEALDVRSARRPHAWLLKGPSGTGKRQLATYIAAAILCESPKVKGHPCGDCPACRWFSQNNHPDFQCVRPDALAALEGSDVDEPAEAPASAETAKKAPSKEIRIDQIRALVRQQGVGSHRGGARVNVIYPAESMNVFTANALLKILEEPAADAVFVLSTDAFDRLLPTVVSRCRQVICPSPNARLAAQWLTDQGVPDAGQRLAAEGGAPLSVLRSHAEPELDAQRVALFKALANSNALDPLACAERLGKVELMTVVGWLQRLTADALSYRLAGQIRYYPSEEGTIAALGKGRDPRALARLSERLADHRRVANHPLNARLFFEALLMDYVATLEGRSIS